MPHNRTPDARFRRATIGPASIRSSGRRWQLENVGHVPSMGDPYRATAPRQNKRRAGRDAQVFLVFQRHRGQTCSAPELVRHTREVICAETRARSHFGVWRRRRRTSDASFFRFLTHGKNHRHWNSRHISRHRERAHVQPRAISITKAEPSTERCTRRRRFRATPTSAREIRCCCIWMERRIFKRGRAPDVPESDHERPRVDASFHSGGDEERAGRGGGRFGSSSWRWPTTSSSSA